MRAVSRRAHVALRLAGLLVSGVVAAGCGAAAPTVQPGVAASPSAAASAGGLGSTPLPSLPAADPAAVEAVRTLITAADFANPSSLRTVLGARYDAGAAEAAAAVLASGAADGPRWAAVVVYGTSGIDPAPLQPLLADPVPSIRAMAAAALASWGVADAVPVLVELTGDDGLLMGSEPPTSVAAFAAETLGRFVRGPEVSPGTDPAAAKTAWQAWLAASAGRLVFDPATGTFSAG